ncbi:serine/threonine protein kinase [Enterovibrio sp. ZSDZ35]|uniref:Serine/threonine protein kinase n=1 Tax=Enterovibrio qingdaonensis TaxID=2899818 RepID=A0ABT5QRR7_9GAMM|nr:serine/threonine-protein kinase [Enterovibrio sp. ZSDZ35]MDD1783378.1 serine/threonine protein kinase [Enterovibrio sp. ZSDZ35]
MEISDLYVELLALSPSEQRIRLGQIREENADIADDLASMLDLPCDDLTDISDALFSSHSQHQSSPDFIGKEVMGFRIEKVLSEGGATGQVFLASQHLSSPDKPEHCQHFAAVKILRGSVLNLRARQTLFYREASNLIALNHPYICQFYGSGEIEGTPCIVTEYVNGNQLDVYLDTHRPTKAERLHLLKQLMDGMAYAHSRGLYHGDLKPQNLLVDDQGNLKIIDLGFSKRIDDQANQDGGIAKDYISAFSRYWSAPEQKDGIWYRSRSDIYSLGMLFFYLLSENNDPYAVEEFQSGVRPEYFVGRGFGKESAAIIAKAVSHDASLRYRDADEMQQDILRWLNRFPVDAYSQSLFYRARKGITRWPLTSAIVLVSTALLVAASVSLIRQHVALVLEKQTSDEVVEQLSNVLLYSQPELAHTFETPSIESLYRYAAKEWVASHSVMTDGARFQTGSLLIKGLQSLYIHDDTHAILKALNANVSVFSDEQQAILRFYQVRNLRLKASSDKACINTWGESTGCWAHAFSAEAWSHLSAYPQHSFYDWLIFGELVNMPGFQLVPFQRLVGPITDNILDFILTDNTRWQALSFSEKHDLLQTFQHRMMKVNEPIAQEKSQALFAIVDEWIKQTSFASETYLAVSSALNLAYVFDDKSKIGKYSETKDTLKAETLSLNTTMLSYEPLVQTQLNNPKKSLIALKETEVEIAEKFGEQNALAKNAIEALSSAYFLLGATEKAQEVLSLDQTPQFQISAKLQPLFGTTPSQMTLAIFHRDWDSFHSAYSQYMALSALQNDQRQPSHDNIYQLFNALLIKDSESPTEATLKAQLPQFINGTSALIYLHFATGITGHPSLSDAFYNAVSENSLSDFTIMYLSNGVPLMEEAVAYYTRTLMQRGQFARAETIIRNVFKQHNKQWYGSDFLKIQVLYLAEGYVQNGNLKVAKLLLEEYALTAADFSFRKDLAGLAAGIDSRLKSI